MKYVEAVNSLSFSTEMSQYRSVSTGFGSKMVSRCNLESTTALLCVLREVAFLCLAFLVCNMKGV